MAQKRSRVKNEWDSSPLTQAAEDLLTSPRKWRIVSSAFEPEVSSITDEQHLEWMRENSHSHEHQEIKIVLRGHGVHGFRGKVYPYSPGTMFLMDSLEEHDHRCPTDASDANMLWVAIVNNMVIFTQIIIRDGDFQYFRWNRMDSNRMLGFAEWKNMLAFIKHQDVPKVYKRLRTYSVITGLLSAILEHGFIDERIGNRETFQRSIVEAVEIYIRDTQSTEISLDYLAHLSGYSKYHLSRLFKHYTGRTIRDHIDHTRMCKAQDMLSTGLSKKEVSSRLGFSCPAAFSRWLRFYAK